jgi:hypothetical protein
MKDLYTFDVSEEKARETYAAVCGAYDRIFTRIGVPFIKAEADTGNIGTGFASLTPRKLSKKMLYIRYHIRRANLQEGKCRTSIISQLKLVMMMLLHVIHANTLQIWRKPRVRVCQRHFDLPPHPLPMLTKHLGRVPPISADASPSGDAVSVIAALLARAGLAVGHSGIRLAFVADPESHRYGRQSVQGRA